MTLISVALVVLLAAAFGTRYSKQITHGVVQTAVALWQLSYFGMVLYLVVQVVLRRWHGAPNANIVRPETIYLGSGFGIAAACFAGAVWALYRYLEHARREYIETRNVAIVEGYTTWAKAKGRDPWGKDQDTLSADYTAERKAEGRDPWDRSKYLTDDDDYDSLSAADPRVAIYNTRIARSLTWAHATTYTLVVVPLFLVALLE